MPVSATLGVGDAVGRCAGRLLSFPRLQAHEVNATPVVAAITALICLAVLPGTYTVRFPRCEA